MANSRVLLALSRLLYDGSQNSNEFIRFTAQSRKPGGSNQSVSSGQAKPIPGLPCFRSCNTHTSSKFPARVTALSFFNVSSDARPASCKLRCEDPSQHRARQRVNYFENPQRKFECALVNVNMACPKWLAR